MALEPALNQRLSDLVTNHQVLLFMKGTRHFPQCGFSATVTQILDGLVPEYKTVNVLTDPEIRQGIKEFSNWPTIPQLYVNGQFVGGCDIVREMYLAGELQTLLGVAEDLKAPSITVSPAAARAFQEAAGDGPPLFRIEATPRFEYSLSVDEAKPGDFQVDAGHQITVLVDRDTAKRTDGLVIDYSSEGSGGFKLKNPNEPPRVRELSPQDLQQMRTAQAGKFKLIDVRTEGERETAKIDDSVLMTADEKTTLMELPKDTPLVFYCHHGQRSRAAAESFLSAGFGQVYNLSGGIDAWSQVIDSSVPRY